MHKPYELPITSSILPVIGPSLEVEYYKFVHSLRLCRNRLMCAKIKGEYEFFWCFYYHNTYSKMLF